MIFENLMVTDRGSTRIVTINRPNVLNALSKKVLQELHTEFLEIKKNDKIKAVIITGAGSKSFVSGADISDMKDLNTAQAKQFSQFGHNVFDLISEMDKPVIAAVNGYALGGGLELALACDFIFAADNAKFGLVEAKLGLTPGFGGVARLARQVGQAYAKEMIFSAKQINATEALRIGLINKISPSSELMSMAIAACEEMSQVSPYALKTVKKLIEEGGNCSLSTANTLESHSFAMAYSSKEGKEGIAAFLEKRKPNFEEV